MINCRNRVIALCAALSLGAAIVLAAPPALATSAQPSAPPEAPQPGDAETATLIGSSVNVAGSSTSSVSAKVPHCTGTSAQCTFVVSTQTDPPVASSGAAMMAAVREGIASGQLPSSIVLRPGSWCFPTASGSQCFTVVYWHTWTQHGCFIACSANQVTQNGKFWTTPNQSFVWETGTWNGIVGYHHCTFDHSIGVSWSDPTCTAPRYAPDSIHSHFRFTMHASWIASESFMLSALHYGDGHTSTRVYSY